MMGVTVRSENVNAALAAAREIAEGPALLREVKPKVDRMVLALQGEAQRLAPLDEGTLGRSGESEVKFAGTTIQGEVTFGGLATAYAEVQHEREDFYHPKAGQAHYLYGPDSAWDQGEDAAVRMLDREVGEIAERYIGGAH